MVNFITVFVQYFVTYEKKYSKVLDDFNKKQICSVRKYAYFYV